MIHWSFPSVPWYYVPQNGNFLKVWSWCPCLTLTFYVYVCMCACVYVCMCACVYVCVCACVCVYGPSAALGGTVPVVPCTCCNNK